ncbi:helix-turn-helix domain protein [Mycobacteroides abscessus MAB_030201_1075]|uniref:Helix-turn-helix domain protein n=1 Tax=Mycobacteroides abscessus MAB_030201_1075 TaxID=1335410 RepID=A0A829PEL4_9MYCO|nr:helix-turn-helix domain protein [Mycobacteroides abscessus MAB_110811_1470]ETZ87564.1 helix-turn-helix domain protein [Mycobacteroides abscessus MAB_030201_1075]
MDTFTAKAQGMTLTYTDGRLTSVTGDAIDPAQVVVCDRRARQLAGGDFTAPDTPTQQSGQYTPEFLQRVATAHARGSYAAVQEEFNVSRRQAARYIARARESGLIGR